MVSLTLLIIGGLFIGLGVSMLRTKERAPDTWLWVGHGEDPFK